MIVTREQDGFTILHGRTENEWVVAPWWPCSGATIRKVAADKMPKAFVDEAVRFADEEFRMTDMVEWLRGSNSTEWNGSMLSKVADEIKRLQGELHSAHAHMNHLRRVTARLRTIADVAKDLVEECRGDLPPSLGVLARLESALHIEWKESNPQ